MKKILILLFVAMALMGCGTKEKNIEVKEELFTFELGAEINVDKSFYFDGAEEELEKATFDLSDVDNSKEGLYEAILTYNEKQIVANIEIKDTVAPIAITKDVTITKGQTLKPEQMVTSVVELNNYTVSFKEAYTFTEIKKYNVIIVVTDAAGNYSEYENTVTVKSSATSSGSGSSNAAGAATPSAILTNDEIKTIISINRPSSYTSMKAYNVYGESINLYGNNYMAGSNDVYTGKKIELKDIKTGEIKYTTTASKYIDQNIKSYQIPEGIYEVYIDGKRLKSDTTVNEVLYTITRNKQNKQVVLYANKNMYGLSLSEHEVFVYVKYATLPTDVYDVIIDPGHSAQTTTGEQYSIGATGQDGLTPKLTEIEQNVIAGLEMKRILEAAGLKVAITRTSKDSVMADYGVGSRVHMSYQKQAKLYISSHLNGAANISSRGYEVYTSIYSSSSVGDYIVNEVKGGMDSTKITGARQIKLALAANPIYDNYFMTRETGGQATLATQNKIDTKSGVANESFGNVPRGAQGILLEYLYLSNSEDCKIWRSSYQKLIEQNANGILKYLGIK